MERAIDQRGQIKGRKKVRESGRIDRSRNPRKEKENEREKRDRKSQNQAERKTKNTRRATREDHQDVDEIKVSKRMPINGRKGGKSENLERKSLSFKLARHSLRSFGGCVCWMVTSMNH